MNKNLGEELIQTIEKALEVISQQRGIIEKWEHVFAIQEETILLKDKKIDIQLQMLQLLELKLKELGFDLEENPLF